jgi:translocation and assembly module TamB
VQVDAETSASLVEAAGQKLTEVRARTTWAGERLGLDATLRDQQRTLDVAGDIVLHTDHQEVHLRNLALRTGGVEWRTEPGRESAIQYANGRVAVDRLLLVSGPSRIEAEGAFGQPGDALRVKATAVDLATVDRLALGTGNLAGTLDASAVVGGSRDALKADATFAIVNGGFRGFKYASFGGTVGYDATGARVDVRLEQSPGAWLTAKGVVPAEAMRPEPGDAAAPTHEDVAEGQGMDVAVASGPLDLSIVEGFVPQVTKASGTVQVDVRALGTVRDPHVSGHVDVRNGAFTVEQLTKGGYTGLDTRITFEPDRVRIGELRILDEHQKPLRISGELGVHARKVGEVRIAVQSEEFEAIDNELADVKLSSDLQVTGELTAPRVAGTVSVHTGTVNVDRILDTFTTGAYSETPTELPTSEGTAGEAAAPSAATADPGAPGADTGTAPPEAAEPTEPPAHPTGFDAVALDVALRVPDNLVIKGDDLNPGSSPVSLGSVNVTLGGDLRATKQPGTPVQIVGTVNTVRGNYDFQGRRFEIARDGRIQFTGGTSFDPRLDVTATRVISGVRAQVHVRGTARRPQLALSSQPPLDEADILSLIVFNQPANALGEGQQASLATRAGALASGFVASTLAQSIGEALEIDMLEVQATPEDGAGPSVTIGEQVGERLFFKFRQAFGAQAVSELILEYQLAPYLRLQTSVAEGAAATERTLMQRVEQGGIDLIFYYAY